MKLSKSKLALAKVINENGGWVDGSMQLATSNKNGSVYLWSNKPRRIRHVWDFGGRFTYFSVAGCRLQNWHQTILSREEYYHAYPKASAGGISLSELMSRKSNAVKADADGWIEWKGGECPVCIDDVVDVKQLDGHTYTARAVNFHWLLKSCSVSVAYYRLHKPSSKCDTGDVEQNPVVKPEFCESVTRSIPDPEAKPTIEQLAQDYRNKIDYANRKQQEVDDAKAAADAALAQLEMAAEAAGLLVSPIREDVKPQPTITEWRELKIGDEVKYISGTADECNGMVGSICKIDGRPECGRYRIKVSFDKISRWCDRWEFIRRP